MSKPKDYGKYGRHHFNNLKLRALSIAEYGNEGNNDSLARWLADKFNDSYKHINDDHAGHIGEDGNPHPKAWKTILNWITPKKNIGYFRPANVDELEALANVFENVKPEELLCDIFDAENEEIMKKSTILECVEPLEILRKIALSYESSQGYFLFSGDEDDDAYLKWIDQIQRARKLILDGTDEGELLKKRMRLCSALEEFISKSEYADGLPEFIIKENRSLLHYTSSYRIANSNLKLFATCGLKFVYYPENVEELIEMRTHFSGLSDDDIDNLFMVELSDAIRNIYEP